MDYLRSDEEQAEALKNWLKKNGPGLALALALGIGSVLGYQKWQSHQVAQVSDAAGRYQRLIELSATDFAEPANADAYADLLSLAESLNQQHQGSQYAALGAAIVAAQAVEKGELDLAVSQLTLAEAGVQTAELKAVMGLRLARLELELGKPEAALARARALSDPSVAASAAELEGDILTMQGALTEARGSLETARELLRASGLNTAVIDLKLSALPKDS
jgi:predicted negative regulator of RcsB-dependent stress response